MADPREARSAPRDFRADKQQWPQGPLKGDAPLEAFLMRQIARNLRAAMKEREWTAGKLARMAGVSRPTVQYILNGSRWSETSTIVALEDALQVRLWGGAHVVEGRRRRRAQAAGPRRPRPQPKSSGPSASASPKPPNR